MFLPPVLHPVRSVVVGFLDRHECHYFDDDRHLSSIQFATQQQTKDIIHRNIRCNKYEMQEKCVSSLELFKLFEWDLFGDIKILSMIARTACMEVLDYCHTRVFHRGNYHTYYQQQFDRVHFEYWRSKDKLIDSSIFSHLFLFHEFEEAEHYWPQHYMFDELDYDMVIWLYNTNKIKHVALLSFYHFSIDVIRVLIDAIPQHILKAILRRCICRVTDPEIFDLLTPFVTPLQCYMTTALERGSFVGVTWLLEHGFEIPDTLYILLDNFTPHELDQLVEHLNPVYFHGLPIYKPHILQWFMDHNGTPMQQTDSHIQCVMNECHIDDLLPLWRIMKWQINESVVHAFAKMCTTIDHVHKLCRLLKMVKHKIRFPLYSHFKFFECTEMIRLALQFRCGPLGSFHVRYLQKNKGPRAHLVKKLLK